MQRKQNVKRSETVSVDGSTVRIETTGKGRFGAPGAFQQVRVSVRDKDSWALVAELRGTTQPNDRLLKKLVREYWQGRIDTCTVCGLMKEPPRIMIARDCLRCQVEAARQLRAQGHNPPVWAKGLGEW
jgi:hypothetical protein